MTDKIQKFIDKLDSKTKARIISILESILESPFSIPNLKKLRGKKNLYRIRIGKIRIIFKISSNKKPEIVDIDFRGDIY